MPRNDGRRKFRNNNKLYETVLDDKDIKVIRQYTTPILSHPTPKQRASLQNIPHIWKLGDRFYKLAHEHYGDSNYWWVIAWYNLAPTENHLILGTTIQIPFPLSKVLSYLRSR